jgi:hypothetical protein
MLRQWLQDHSDHPYPSRKEKLALVKKTRLSKKQIQNWFTNARKVTKLCVLLPIENLVAYREFCIRYAKK